MTAWDAEMRKISPSRTLPIGARAVSQSALSHPSGAVRRLRAGFGPPTLFAKHAPVAQLDRASDYESEGRTFESFRARHKFINHINTLEAVSVLLLPF
jgi:hypothetical protein